ncbi:MAG TPA: DMT family transporter [Gaiellaceae bacterium]|jgi:drug/metabolite transporter (DMT)-like permease|nr:DMT family transporter [Gaiellaceae bacterium]
MKVVARHRNLAMLIGLALIWGASFLFIKVTVRELTPATLIVGRLGLAAITLGLLVPFVVGLGETARQLHANWVWLVVVALVNTAIPFWLLSWGETRIDSGLASIIQASVPIFNAVIAFVAFREVRVTGIRLLGVAVGFVGVALLVGAQPEGKVLGALAVVGMAFCYGLGGLLSGRYLKPAQPVVVSFASTAIAALVWLPVGVAQAPAHMPGWKTIGSVLALGIPGTALAYLLFFGLITGAGAAYASLVTYLIPPIALAYGAIFLDERFGAAALGGLALILAGVALGTGAVHLKRARQPQPADG